ncbi:hypothetical protein ACX64P_20365 [Raoultella ornithinolytica]
MTSKLTREQLHERARENVKALKMASRQHAFESAREEILADLQLAELALAAMDSEPVGYFGRFDPDDEDIIDQCSKNVKGAFPLYRHAQPVAVDEIAEQAGISPATADAYMQGYHDAEARKPAPVVTFYRDGIEAAAKWIDQQREAYDSEHGWSDPDTGAFEFGNDAQREYSSTLEELAEGIRALHPNAGNSPVTPDGYVMVPKEPTQAMYAAFNDSDYGRKSLRERYVAMLAAAPQEGKGE